jgi:demethylmenaquinone methyltransferase/2-methoxy-6-polyprenyl-1,4-benzoquinol methylase
MSRVCASGGRVAVLEFSRPRWPVFRAVYGWYFHTLLPKIGQWVARSKEQAYDYLPESVGEFIDGEALAEQMRWAGLRDVQIRPLTLGIATLYVGTKG